MHNTLAMNVSGLHSGKSSLTHKSKLSELRPIRPRDLWVLEWKRLLCTQRYTGREGLASCSLRQLDKETTQAGESQVLGARA